MKEITKDFFIKLLHSIYNMVLEGKPIPQMGGIVSIKNIEIEKLAKDYLKKCNGDKEKAINSLIKWHTTKNSFSSRASSILSFAGIPLTIATSFYIQMRMIAGIAKIAGYDPRTDQVKTLVFLCLVGNSSMNILKQTGIKITEKLTYKTIESISRESLKIINQKVGFRLLTKFGEKGIINLSKAVPIAGSVIAALFDGSFCYISGKTAKKLFQPKQSTLKIYLRRIYNKLINK